MHKTAYIYLAQQVGSNLYKIGSSYDPDSRIKQLQTANGEKIQLIETFETSYKFKLEKSLHRKFIQHQTLGEWFALREEDVLNFIKICKIQEDYFNLLIENNTYIQDRELKNKKW